ncbi:ATP-binding protein [Lactobacillus sp. YT155]|uniref:ATP-binding protein n=1 Tax=Lactobacillus sp. YT155 TaxID=3060955 RepID=UPI00265E7245|nr:ATP-binding protein [Lactobacillus sp. YT155]MDO1604737.1 ATP-binding protein [Lactobacillus sp. YT155]
MKRKISLRIIIISLILLTVSSSLIVSNILTYQNVTATQRANIRSNIKKTAEIVSDSNRVKFALEQGNTPANDSELQKYTTYIQDVMKVDFVVVLDQKLTRYTHPDTKVIGKTFSSPKDASKSLNGKPHFSTKEGVLGMGYRYFQPIYNKQHQQIGMVCVGLTNKSIGSELAQEQTPIYIGLALGLFVGLIAAWLVASHVRKLLLGMEPEEIAEKVTEMAAINNSMSEGLIAIDDDKRVLSMNPVARSYFPQQKEQEQLTDELFENIFEASFYNHTRVVNKAIIANARELIISVTPLEVNGKNIGGMAVISDQSDYKELTDRLSGSEQYIQSLRAQTHEFLNKMQTIVGLIELKQYDDLENFIMETTKEYRQNFGDFNDHIQSPTVSGFLIGKMRQANEQGISLRLNKKSLLPKKIVTNELAIDLIKILGNLIDNSFDEFNMNEVEHPEITLGFNYDEESNILIVEEQNNGSNLTDEQKSKIFDLKYSTKGNNRGYGMALVKQLIDSKNGFIEATNVEPQGTLFYIELPIESYEGDEN